MGLFAKTIFFFYLGAQLSLAQDASSYQLKEEAENYLSDGKLGEAIDLLNKYISADPGKADGYYLRGEAFEKRGNYESAIRDYQSASKLEPGNRNYSVNLTRAREVWNKLLVNRIEGYKREIVVNPSNPKNYLEIGKSYKNFEDWESAEFWYDEYLKREEASPDEILRYTEVLTKLKKFRKGEPILKKYTSMYPGDHRIWSRYGYFNLWLGNKNKAIDAFEEALRIRPYFKEAMEGLDQAKGKGYNYTYTSAPRGTPQYAIDKYYRELKSSPGNNAVRLLLVKELMKHNRYEEAYQQLEILKKNQVSTAETDSLRTEADQQRKKAHYIKIDELRAQYDKGKVNNDLLLQLARRYSYVEEYDSSSFFYQEYLKLNPGDLAVRFEYAKVLAWNEDYEVSRKEVSLLLNLDPGNPEYRLLYATLSVWMLQDLETAEEYLNSILEKDPNNFEALISSVWLNIQKKDFTVAEDFLQRAKDIDPLNERIVKLESDLDFHKLRAEEERIFQILEAGRELAAQNKCIEALKFYEEYLSQVDPNRMVRKEYADVLACAGYYDRALKIYDDLLAAEYNFETDLQRAKVYYWSGDSLKAMQEFKRLYASNPENFDVRMYLGDTYTQMKMYPEAEAIYDQMLSSGLDSTQKQLIVLRKGWLPVGGAGLLNFPIMVAPSSVYYEDNFDFSYNQQLLRVDLNVTPWMSVSPEASFGFLSSDLVRNSFTGFRGYLLFRITEQLLLGGGGGVTMFKDLEESPYGEGFIKYEKPEIYSASFTYNHVDAAFVLYSPSLVDRRLSSDLFRLAGFYRFTSGIKLSGYANRIYVSDDNSGLLLEAEAGMYFTRKFYAGYEFFNESFNNVSVYYYSPEHYTTHSLTAEYDFIKEKVNRLTLGGKLGLISNSNFILREIYVGGMYNIISNLTGQARISYGTTLQNDLGYSSFAAQLAFYWLL